MTTILTTIGWTLFGCVFILTIGYSAILIHKQETEKEIRLKELELEMFKERNHLSK